MNHTDDQLKQRDVVSDTPRTDAAAFGTDDESLNRLFGIRELPRYVVPVDFARILERELAAAEQLQNEMKAALQFAKEHLNDTTAHAEKLERSVWESGKQLAAVTADLEFRRALGALQQQEYDKVTAERDVLRADICAFAVDMEKQLSASQQESKRLREALDVCQKAIGQNYGVLKQAQGHLEHSKIAGMVFYESAMRQLDESLTKAVSALASAPSTVHRDTERLKKVKSALEWIAESRSGHASTLAREALPAIDAELAKEGK